MANPRALTVGDSHSGVSIEYVKRRNVVCINGWYDHVVGIDGAEVPLKDFFNALGITLADCHKALCDQNKT